MKIGTKLTVLNVLVTFTLISAITTVILIRAGQLQRTAALENMTNLSVSIANDVLTYSNACVDMLTSVALTTCYDASIPVEERRLTLQRALTILVAGVPEFISAYAIFPPDAYDGMDAAYAGTLGATESGQLAFLATKVSGSLELKTHERYREIAIRPEDTILMTDPVLQTLNGSQEYLMDIGISVTLPGQAAGILAVQVQLTGLQAAVESVHPYGTGYVLVYSHSGAIARHYETDKVGMDFRRADANLLGTEGIAVVESVLNGRAGETFIYNDFVTAVYPFNTIGGPKWALVSFAPLKDVLAPVYTLVYFSIFFAVVAILAATAIIFMVSKRFAMRIVQVADAVKTIARGDFSLRLGIHTNDEIGAMAGDFNETLQQIGGMIGNIKSRSVGLAKINDKLSTSMAETVASVSEIASAIQNIKSQADIQSGSVVQTSSSIGKIIENIERLNTHISSQADSVSQSSAAIEELLANIASVTQTLVKNDDNVKKLAQASDAGRTGLQAVTSEIREIAKQSEGLLEITTLMNSIASQTNLLSMNAAIEAAHAGESGRGFAVVADEIRKLAESSGQQSKTIAGVLKKIKSSIDEIGKSADGVIERFEAIDQNVRVVADQEADVRNAMEEQGTGSKQILEFIGTLNGITGVIEKDSGEMLVESREIIEESKRLEKLTREITVGIKEGANGVDEINTAVDRVSGVSEETKQFTEILISEISKFKTS
ncbi:MAG: methyl-accepting chemotaxis protein [Treponema sp.]|jgi:methyl-accepting chemotaxis protein|nr:methyl-accepting chemotaxis protein [Treponema sp.]